ncbi:MAG TPA: hypothetical protein VF017_02700 [Thermoanaerobaculia bacterium]|nr:hypothetical protein [Thermoanaerobaculia bacterium]
MKRLPSHTMGFGHALNLVNRATELRGKALAGAPQATGAGLGYQLVAQATGQAVADATTFLRSIEMIAAVTSGVAAAQIVANPSNASTWTGIITDALGWVSTAAGVFATIGADAGTVLSGYPQPS